MISTSKAFDLYKRLIPVDGRTCLKVFTLNFILFNPEGRWNMPGESSYQDVRPGPTIQVAAPASGLALKMVTALVLPDEGRATRRPSLGGYTVGLVTLRRAPALLILLLVAAG